MLYKFEDYELDTDRHEFRASGELRAVQPQVFELIRYLLENHGRLVTRDALITAVWDGRIVSESTIDARIHAARKAMDDDGRRQARIKTVPRRGYRLVSAVEIVQSNDLQATASNADARQHFPPPTDRPSIAVLPFQNFSDRPEQDYFSEGIAEDIITALSRFRWFFVIARSSSFTYRGGAHDVRQIAQELGVRYLLEGSVRKTDDRVRVSAQLIDAISGNHIWAETYDRELADMFALQDEMTATIVGAIEPELGDVESVRAKNKPPDNLDAWESYQRGLWHVWRITQSDVEEAERLFRQAIELDSGFAPAYGGLALALIHQVNNAWTQTPDATISDTQRAAERAVALDDKDAFAHFVLGRVHTMQSQYEAAIAEMEKALDLNPNLAAAFYGLGYALAWSGRPREALPLFHKAIRQSPRAPFRWHFENMLGISHILLSEYRDAAEWCLKATRYPTSGWWSYVNLAVALVGLERLDDARAALNDAVRLRSDLSQATVATTMLRQLIPDLKRGYLEKLRVVGLPE